METVITVCGNADQACPMFPGHPNRHHFPLPPEENPAFVTDDCIQAQVV